MSIGDIFSAGRARLGLTQAQLAAKVGCDRTYISHLEAGRAGVSLALAGRLARALDLPQCDKSRVLDLAAEASDG